MFDYSNYELVSGAESLYYAFLLVAFPQLR